MIVESHQVFMAQILGESLRQAFPRHGKSNKHSAGDGQAVLHQKKDQSANLRCAKPLMEVWSSSISEQETSNYLTSILWASKMVTGQWHGCVQWWIHKMLVLIHHVWGHTMYDPLTFGSQAFKETMVPLKSRILPGITSGLCLLLPCLEFEYIYLFVFVWP